MIASLMMYARPETDGALARFWAAIRAELAQRGIDSPETLSQEAPEFEVWENPDLVLSQTCGMPYRSFLHEKVQLVGTPDYGLEGCPEGYYRSAFVVRADDPHANLSDFRNARFAFNQTISQSGYAAPYWHCTSFGFWFEKRLQSHGHLRSAQMVAKGHADIAALDAVTWRLIQTYEPWASKLRVLDWTPPTPGLPLITAQGHDASAIFDTVGSALSTLPPADRSLLGITKLLRIPREAYLAVPNPPESA